MPTTCTAKEPSGQGIHRTVDSRQNTEITQNTPGPGRGRHPLVITRTGSHQKVRRGSYLQKKKEKRKGVDMTKEWTWDPVVLNHREEVVNFRKQGISPPVYHETQNINLRKRLQNGTGVRILVDHLHSA